MDSAQFNRVMSLFQDACVLPEAQRAAYLDRHCPEAVIRREVEALLKHDARPVSVLASPGAGAQWLAAHIATTEPTLAPSKPSASTPRFPVLSNHYRILRVIGEGGMGVVYEAEQARPRRRVALKAIRPGMASRHILRRFEREAHILGRLHHPGIAQIYEAGAGDEARPDQAYFVMEFVDGLPLTHHATRKKLTIDQRLGLFAKVCDALQHAHQRGVIHRDLKPANIVVTVAGEPKILDFGVARLADEDHVTTFQTLSGQLLGTLPYMSPEQVSGDPRDIDTRTDVYTLGVILFQLFSGQLPLDLSNRSVAEGARIIRDEPAKRLSAVRPDLRGDLETIDSRAMERDPIRRYQSADELGADIRRYLRGQPIVARSDAVLYILRKRLWRNRWRVLAIVCIVGLLIGLGVEIWRRDRQWNPPTARQTSNYLGAMLKAYQARQAGDDKTYRETLTYLENELHEDEAHVVALINETVPPVFNTPTAK